MANRVDQIKKVKILTPKQEKWANEFVIDLNATQAAKRSGYGKNLPVAGSNNLKNPAVMARVKELQKEVSKRVKLSQERVLQEIMALAFSDVRDLFDDIGRLKPMSEWSEQAAASVSSIKVFELDKEGLAGTISDIKFWDKGRQIELLCKHLGMLTERLQVDINATVKDERISSTNEWIESVILRGTDKKNKESVSH